MDKKFKIEDIIDFCAVPGGPSAEAKFGAVQTMKLLSMLGLLDMNKFSDLNEYAYFSKESEENEGDK